MSNKLEQLEFILEKIIGIQKHAGKVRKDLFLFCLFFIYFFIQNQKKIKSL